jgi:hypothetical protein
MSAHQWTDKEMTAIRDQRQAPADIRRSLEGVEAILRTYRREHPRPAGRKDA